MRNECSLICKKPSPDGFLISSGGAVFEEARGSEVILSVCSLAWEIDSRLIRHSVFRRDGLIESLGLSPFREAQGEVFRNTMKRVFDNGVINIWVEDDDV